MHRLTGVFFVLTTAGILAYGQASPPAAPKPKPSTARVKQGMQSTKPATPPKSAPQAQQPPSCDELAAHPEDEGKTGTGVADDAIKSDLAIEQCTLAVEKSPQEARLHFQLGRAYWTAKDYDAALDAFTQAEELGYAPAYFYLAQAYEQGLIEGEAEDHATARDMYMLAAAEGFEPAARAYADFEEVFEIDYAAFNAPTYVQIFYEGEPLEHLNLERRVVVAWVRGLQSFIHREVFAFDPGCKKIADPAVSTALDKIMEAEFSSRTEMITAQLGVSGMSEVRKLGENDMNRFAAEYGGCLSEPVARLYDGVKRYLREHPARK